MSLEIPGPSRGVERRVIGRFGEFEQNGAGVVEESHDVAFENVGWLIDFTKSPEAIYGVVPDEGLQ